MSSSLDKQMNKRKEKKDKKLKESLKDDKLKIKMQEVYKWPETQEQMIMTQVIILTLVKSQNNSEKKIVKISKKQF